MAVVSLIIPVYNASAYISKAITAIRQQSLQDIEVIVVNDGSKDDSLSMLQSLVATDDRFVIIDQVNAGVSNARNKGLQYVNSEYVVFMDVDDAIKSGYLEHLVQAIQEAADIDLAIEGFDRIDLEGNILNSLTFTKSTVDTTQGEAIFDHHRIHDYGYSWGKIYKSSIIKKHQLQFNEQIHLYEDTLWVLNYVMFCRKISFLDTCNYQYQWSPNSLSNKKRSFEFSYLPYSLLKSFTQQQQVISKALHERWAVYLHDVIVGIYINGYDKAKRKTYLQQITDSDWKLYHRYYEPHNFVTKYFKKLLIAQKWPLADLLMNLYFNRK